MVVVILDNPYMGTGLRTVTRNAYAILNTTVQLCIVIISFAK
jgi:hypothetical protein